MPELTSPYRTMQKGKKRLGAFSWARDFALAWKGNDAFEWVVFWAFMAGLAWVPFWYGSNELIAWGINAVVFPGLVVIYELSKLVSGDPHAVGVKEIRIPVTLFVVVVIWIVIQNATWTFSSWHHPIWAMAAETLETPVEGSISVNRDLTTLALLRLITAASVFWLALQLCRDPRKVDRFLAAFVIISCGYAAYGLIAFAAAQANPADGRHFVTSTFYSHNHYAAYGGLGFLAVCGLIIRAYQRELGFGGASLGFRIAAFIEATGQRTAPLLGSAFVILVSVLLSGSRGGIIATMIGLAAFGILSSRRNRPGTLHRRGALVFATGVLLVTLLAVLFVFGDMFALMITEKGLTDENRWAVQAITLRSIFDAPLLGYGYGTFADVFPLIRDRSISVQGIWEQAHNTYLEVYQGLGLVVGSMLVGSVVLLVLMCVKGAFVRQEGATIPGMAASAAVLVGVHSLVDFSLQMQAVALTFMALLGAGVAQSKSSRLALSD